jgi:hypothetical protein
MDYVQHNAIYDAVHHASVPRESELRLGEGSVQDALSVARPPEVSRFGSFVKPTADWF